MSIVVDADLYVSRRNTLSYGSSPDRSELWWPLLEKAFAELNGSSYENIGTGGRSDDAMQRLLGRPASSLWLTRWRATTAWERLTESLNARMPVTVSLFDANPVSKRLELTANHTYSVLAYKTENGERWVQIRNPAGAVSQWIDIRTFAQAFDVMDYVK
jgi:hypothetical protein